MLCIYSFHTLLFLHYTLPFFRLCISHNKYKSYTTAGNLQHVIVFPERLVPQSTEYLQFIFVFCFLFFLHVFWVYFSFFSFFFSFLHSCLYFITFIYVDFLHQRFNISATDLVLAYCNLHLEPFFELK